VICDCSEAGVLFGPLLFFACAWHNKAELVGLSHTLVQGHRSNNPAHSLFNTHTHLYPHTHTFIPAYTHLYPHTHTFIPTYTHMYTHIHTHLYPHTHTFIPTYRYIYTHIHTHLYPHTHAFIPTYTHLYTRTGGQGRDHQRHALRDKGPGPYRHRRKLLGHVHQ
jgi:hypothetical protein